MAEQYLVMPITIVKGAVFEDYVYIPTNFDYLADEGLTNVTFKAEVRDKPAGTLLATFRCNPNIAPPTVTDPGNWVQIRLDDTDTDAITAFRGTWSLLAAFSADNYDMIAGGPVEILRQATA